MVPFFHFNEIIEIIVCQNCCVRLVCYKYFRWSCGETAVKSHGTFRRRRVFAMSRRWISDHKNSLAKRHDIDSKSFSTHVVRQRNTFYTFYAGHCRLWIVRVHESQREGAIGHGSSLFKNNEYGFDRLINVITIFPLKIIIILISTFCR